MSAYDFEDQDGHGGAVLDRPGSSRSPQRPDYGPHDDSIPTVSFPLPSSRLAALAAKLTAAAGLGLLSAFLLSEMPKTPELKANILVLSGVGLLVAAVLTVLAVRDALCRLVIGQFGVSVGPWPFTKTVDWSTIVAWRMSLEDDDPSPLRQLVLYTAGKPFPVLINIGGLSVNDHRALHKVMRMRLGDEG
jgi:hypothetical protein